MSKPITQAEIDIIKRSLDVFAASPREVQVAFVNKLLGNKGLQSMAAPYQRLMDEQSEVRS